MKNVFHHDTVVTNLQYYCKQCNNVDVVQHGHVCLFLQFIRNSARDGKTLVYITLSISNKISTLRKQQINTRNPAIAERADCIALEIYDQLKVM